MSSAVVDRLPHECGSRKALNVFQNEDGTYSGWCFSCKTYVPNPYGDKPEGYIPPAGFKKSPEEIQKELDAISKFKCVALPDRKISKDSLAYFGITISVSEEDGETPVAHYYPYTKEGKQASYKVRLIESKKFWGVGDRKDNDLFGWVQACRAGSKRLYITEGELDAVATFQMLRDANKHKQEYADLIPAVVSLPDGAGCAAKALAKHAAAIRQQFKEVVLLFDDDEPGKQATEEAMKVLPEAMSAKLPAKDANACLMEGRQKAFIAAVVFNAKKPKNTRLVNASSLFKMAKKAAEWGFSWPWKHVNEATRGLRFGDTIYIGAGPKQGKSEIVNALASHFIKHHKWKVLLAKPEEANVKSVKMVAGKMVGKIFHDPKIQFDEGAYDKAVSEIGENLILLNLYQHVGWETLKADIREAASDGCKAIFIDPITNLTNGMEAAVANVKLQEISQELSSMALDLQIIIFIFCHLRNPDAGPPHERGGEVLSSQFAGSRAMARSCSLMFGLEGNRDPNLPHEQRNLRTFVLLEDREFGESGRFPLYWDSATGLFNELA